MRRRHQNKTHQQRKARYIILLTTLLSVSIYSLWTSNNSYPASLDALAAMESSEQVEVTRKDNVISFLPKEKSIRGFVIYPDAALDPQAYAPLAQDLVDEFGSAVYVVTYPLRKNYLHINAIKTLQKNHPETTDWYVLAHGSGGTFSNFYLNDQVKAIFFLSGYPIRKLQSEVAIVTMHGSLDGVHETVAWKKKMKLFPKQTIHYQLETANYSYFSSFGLRKEDNVGLLTPKEQRQLAIENMNDFIEVR